MSAAGDIVGVSPIEEIIEDARQGMPFILVDANDRENEGDLIMPAQFATPRVVNFMAKHARGLICLALTADRAAELRLSPMTANNRSGHGTAFTVSIEAREGVSTGISAHDRALTIAVATDPGRTADDLVSPGHVFPLVARDGGVLVRAGHTEAAVDIARLAGLHPAGVICEIMSDDGTMARMPELLTFAREHQLKVGTIADLIALRRKTEKLIEHVVEAPFETHFNADFQIHVFRNRIDLGEHVALVRGKIDPEAETLVRVHQVDLTADLLGWTAARKNYVNQALMSLAEYPGAAVGVFVRDPNPSSISDRVSGGRRDYHLQHGLRDYGVGAQILKHLGVRRMRLMTSSDAKLFALEGFGLEITSRVAIPLD
ncbi:Riboflavin biosynthesis protein RibBA [compost metagenome]